MFKPSPKSPNRKTIKQIGQDEKEIKKSERRLRRFLDRQNPRKVRRDEIMDGIAKIAFVIFAVALLVFYILIQRGYLG